MIRRTAQIALLVGSLTLAGQVSAHGRDAAVAGAIIGATVAGAMIYGSRPAAAPVYVAPPPVYYAPPPPVYYAPPPPVYYAPPPVVYYRPAYYGYRAAPPRYHNGPRYDWHHGRH